MQTINSKVWISSSALTSQLGCFEGRRICINSQTVTKSATYRMPALWIHVASFTRGNSVCSLSFRNPSQGAVNHRNPLPCMRRMAADKALLSADPGPWMHHLVGLCCAPKGREKGAQLRGWITFTARHRRTSAVSRQE